MGDSPTKVVLHVLKSKYGLVPEQISDNPERFVLAMRELFGVGSAVVFRSILVQARAIEPGTEEGRRILEKFINTLQVASNSVESGIQ